MSAEEEAVVEAAPKKGGNKAVIAVGFLALLLGAGAGFGGAQALGGGGEEAPEAEAAAEHGEPGAAAEGGHGEPGAAAEGGGHGEPGAAAEGGHGEPAAEGHGAAASPGPGANIGDLGEFTVNLRSTAGSRVLQMKISVEGKPEVIGKLAAHQPQLRDAVLMLTSDYTLQELDGLDNRLAFRDEIHTRLNTVLAPQKLDRIYFTDFVIQ